MKHLFSIRDLGVDGIHEVFARVDAIRATPLDELRKRHANRIVTTLFMEPSTRTRLSFELAAQRNGADVVSFTPETSSTTKGESLQDTVQTLSAMETDLFIVRNKAEGSAERIAQWTDAKIINGGEGVTSHPTQALLDLVALRDARPGQSFEGMNQAIVGDIRHGRTARSLSQALTALGANVVLVGPPEFLPESVDDFRAGSGTVTISNNFDEVVPTSDAVYMLRVQFERHMNDEHFDGQAYLEEFGFTKARLAALPEASFVMHPGPMNRGIEIDTEVADCSRSLVKNQVTCGLHVRTALIDWMLSE